MLTGWFSVERIYAANLPGDSVGVPGRDMRGTVDEMDIMRLGVEPLIPGSCASFGTKSCREEVGELVKTSDCKDDCGTGV